MEESESVSTSKKQRTEVDEISGLPDSLLVHILSFLPTKEAIATSLLFKRWRPLWLSLPTLDFNRNNFQRLPLFHRFVDKVLKLVDLKSVKKFVLRCDHVGHSEHFRPLKISKWINAVISRKVEHLELHLMRWVAYELPSSVFNANNIRVLKLSGVTVNTLSHVGLPFLEVLHLRDVKFSDFTSLEMLLTASALLKDLVVRFSYEVDYHHPLNIARLDHLVTVEVPQSLIPLEVFSNVKCLRLYRDMWPFSDVIPMFNNVTQLECVAEEWTQMVNCLVYFPKLQKLVIYEVGSSSPPVPIHDVPPCVLLHLRQFTLGCFELRDSGNEFEMLKFMMKSARVLRTIFVRALVSNREYGLQKFLNLAAYLGSGYENCSRMLEQPLIFMIFYFDA